jgi:hypothetical protein
MQTRTWPTGKRKIVCLAGLTIIVVFGVSWSFALYCCFNIHGNEPTYTTAYEAYTLEPHTVSRMLRLQLNTTNERDACILKYDNSARAVHFFVA